MGIDVHRLEWLHIALSMVISRMGLHMATDIGRDVDMTTYNSRHIVRKAHGTACYILNESS